jgi:phage/plasmid-associated DNA primase
VETETLKQVVSGDLIKGGEKFGKQFEFRPRTKCIFSLNKKPILQDVGYALERRVIVVPFDTTFEGKTKVESIWEKIVAGDGRHGVFMWMVQGLEDLLKHGFEITGRVKSCTTAFLRSLNPVMIFVQDVCRLRPGDNKTFVGTVELYKRYVQWCGHTKHKELARTNFWDNIESIPGVVRKLDNKTRRANFFGIEIRTDDLGEEAEGCDDLEEVDPSTPQPFFLVRLLVTFTKVWAKGIRRFLRRFWSE